MPPPGNPPLFAISFLHIFYFYFHIDRLADHLRTALEGQTALGKEKKEPAPLVAAVPEDIEHAVEKWSAIVGQAAMPMKAYLKTAYPSLSGDGSMLVVV